jgi:hypothetical protein
MPLEVRACGCLQRMVPSALAFGAGGEFRAHGARRDRRALFRLSLIFVPAVVILMDNMSQLSSRRRSGFVGKAWSVSTRRLPATRMAMDRASGGVT